MIKTRFIFTCLTETHTCSNIASLEHWDLRLHFSMLAETEFAVKLQILETVAARGHMHVNFSSKGGGHAIATIGAD
jgi:hypothetical protein